MPQLRLSKLTGIPQSSLSEIESGQMIPKERHIKAIAEVLGVSEDELRE